MQFNNNAVILDPKKVPEPCHTFEWKKLVIEISLKQKKSSNDGGLDTQTNTQKTKHKLDKPIIHISGAHSINKQLYNTSPYILEILWIFWKKYLLSPHENRVIQVSKMLIVKQN